MSSEQPHDVVVLGSTGSIGRQALEVIVAGGGRWRVAGLAAGSSVAPLLEQAAVCGAGTVCLQDAAAAADAAARAPELAVLAGDAGVRELIESAAADAAAAGRRLTVLNAVVGAAGLRATMLALEIGADLALANKESVVAGGPFVLAAARRSGARILPVDSEHSAIFQCLEAGGGSAAAEEILLTGSGGPFRGRTAADLAAVTPGEALAHPTWAMGPKISVDSATLMNKGLEVIEAHYLFGVPYERITVVLDPRSVVHSMVRLVDGAVLAHLGVPDMRVPIGYALGYPGRPSLPDVRRLDVFAAGIAFERPDEVTFRCLALAREAGRMAARAESGLGVPAATGASGADVPEAPAAAAHTCAAPIVLNAANEVAVGAFLESRLPFLGIADVVERCLTLLGDEPVATIDDVYACDADARRFAAEAAAQSA